MKDIKIVYIPRKGNDFHASEEAIKDICKEGWELVNVSPDPLNSLKFIAVFTK